MRGNAAAAPSGHGSLPYHIPGPAGFGISPVPNRSALGSRTSTGNGATGSLAPSDAENRITENGAAVARARPFDTPAWHALLRTYELRPYGSEFLASSVALVKNNAMSGVFTKSRLAVRVERLSFVGKDASVTLADPTGAVVGTMLAEIFADRKSGVEEGAVLMLKGIAAIMYPERRVTGFRANLNEAMHISVQSANIERVFAASDDSKLPRKFGILPYRAEAMVEPKITQQALRRQRSSAITPVRPLTRTPIRPGSGHPGTSPLPNNGRPYSSPRGRSFETSRGRPQRPYGSGSYGRPNGAPYNSDSPPHQQGMQYGRGGGYRGRPRGGMYNRGGSVRPHGDFPHGQEPPRRVGQPASHHQSYPRFNNPNLPQSNRHIVKRPNAQQIQSPRPSQRPRYESQDKNPPLQSCPTDSNAADVLTDDQLDNLLGSMDIDAAIAAATQSTSPQGKENTLNESAQNSNLPLASSQQEKEATASTENAASASRSTTQPTSAPEPSTQAPATDKGTDGVQSVQAVQPGKGIGAIDDSMLDSLLDGLDSSDFT